MAEMISTKNSCLLLLYNRGSHAKVMKGGAHPNHWGLMKTISGIALLLEVCKN